MFCRIAQVASSMLMVEEQLYPKVLDYQMVLIHCTVGGIAGGWW